MGRIPRRDILRMESHGKGKCFAGMQVISFCDADKQQNPARQYLEHTLGVGEEIENGKFILIFQINHLV